MHDEALGGVPDVVERVAEDMELPLPACVALGLVPGPLGVLDRARAGRGGRSPWAYGHTNTQRMVPLSARDDREEAVLKTDTSHHTIEKEFNCSCTKSGFKTSQHWGSQESRVFLKRAVYLLNSGGS